MFEEELELEKRGSSRPLWVLVLVLAVVAGIGYLVLIRSLKPLSQAGAVSVVNNLVAAMGPARVSFRVGPIGYEDNPSGPHYRLLEKAGYVKVEKKGTGTRVEVTPLGQSTFSELPEFKKVADRDGSEVLKVPLADRQLVAVTKVTMISPKEAAVDYTWQWKPNKLGDEFDVHSGLVESFNTWDRATLIEKYGVNFYHGEAHRETVTLARTNQGWKVANP